MRINENQVRSAIRASLSNMLNEGKTDDIIAQAVNAVMNSEELTNKAYRALSPRMRMFPNGTLKQQQKWRIQGFIDETPEIFKGIMSIPLRNKVAMAIYQAMCKRYNMN